MGNNRISMGDSVVERVARAIASADEFSIFVRRDKMRDDDQWEVACFEDGSDASQKIYGRFQTADAADEDCARRIDERRARAAIAAMREPTLDMEVAGTEQWLCEAAMEDRSKANWQAMIDAALSE